MTGVDAKKNKNDSMIESRKIFTKRFPICSCLIVNYFFSKSVNKRTKLQMEANWSIIQNRTLINKINCIACMYACIFERDKMKM